MTDLEKLIKHFNLKGKQIRLAKECLVGRDYDTVHFFLDMEATIRCINRDKARLKWLRSLQNVSLRLKSRLKKIMKKKIRYIYWR